jgi:TonB-dependent SusC/RagA subfamily outer membrane receptor
MKAKIFFLLIIVFVASNHVQGQKKCQRVVVSGTVTDINKSPVAGAMILVDKQNTKIVTDSQGIFKIKLRPDVKMIGAFTSNLGSAEVALDGKTMISITLDGSYAIKDYVPEKPEDEETVNIGYGTAKKKDLTTQPGQIDASQNRYVSYINIYDMIRGEIPGIQVTGTKIIIRGFDPINSNGPLFVVDGIVVTSIDYISPWSVKSISVLKGVDATIYGSRAAGGVILIDLKGAE